MKKTMTIPHVVQARRATLGMVIVFFLFRNGTFKNIPQIPDRLTKQPKPIGNQSRTVALRPGAAGKTSKPVSGKSSFMMMFFSGP